MTACFLQLLRPDDIVFLIEAGLQLYQDRNLLAVLCCLSQSRDDRRIAADTVQGLLDGQNVRVLRRLLARNSPPDRKVMIRMMEEDIPFPDLGENIVVVHQRRYRLGLIGGLLQMVEALHSVHLHKEGQIQRTAISVKISSPLNMEVLFSGSLSRRLSMPFPERSRRMTSPHWRFFSCF